MGVYLSDNGCYYSTGPESDPALCLADGGYYGGFFGTFSKTQVNRHDHKCERVQGHQGKHLCGNQSCNHEWLNCFGCGKAATTVHKKLVVPVCENYPKCEATK